MAVKNKYNIERNYVSNKLARSKHKLGKVRFLVAHETANPSADADDHYKYFDGIDFEASAHTFIDPTKILEIIPLDEKAWHVQYQKPTDNRMFGDDANDAAIGVELCRPGDFKKAYDRYVWYFAYLCHKFSLQPKKHIVAHSTLDPQRRSDPVSWLNPNGVTWTEFINDVQRYFEDWEGVAIGNKATPPKKSVSQMADEVIGGKHGNGHENRRNSLGISQSVYNQVRDEVNKRFGGKSSGKSISQMATEVIRGDHGNGHENRRKSLGVSQSEYEKVRAEVNKRL
jgi:N-acetylmuramoyl-L-alanine amidase CwlA